MFFCRAICTTAGKVSRKAIIFPIWKRFHRLLPIKNYKRQLDTSGVAYPYLIHADPDPNTAFPNSVVDRQRVDAVPDRDPTFHLDANPDPAIKAMPTHMRTLPQVWHRLENRANFFTFNSQQFSMFFSFLVGGKYVMILSILTVYLNCHEKGKYTCAWNCYRSE